MQSCTGPITISVDWINREVTVNNSTKEIKLTNNSSCYNTDVLFEENEKPITRESHSNFVLGRKKQFIHDFWPLPSKYCRKDKMPKILDSLIGTEKDIEQCVAISSIKLGSNNRDIDDFSTRIPLFIRRNKTSCNEEIFGKHYQYILDNNLDYTHELLCEMSMEEIKSTSSELHDKKELEEEEIEYREGREKVLRKSMENIIVSKTSNDVKKEDELVVKEETNKLLEVKQEDGVTVHEASKTPEYAEHIAFYRGRATQLISDLYPNIKPDFNRATNMEELLPSLTNDDDTLQANVAITINKLKLPTRNELELLNVYPCAMLKGMTDGAKFEYGRNYQFLLDTDRRKYHQTDLLTKAPHSVKWTADELREKLANKFQNQTIRMLET